MSIEPSKILNTIRGYISLYQEKARVFGKLEWLSENVDTDLSELKTKKKSEMGYYRNKIKSINNGLPEDKQLSKSEIGYTSTLKEKGKQKLKSDLQDFVLRRLT